MRAPRPQMNKPWQLKKSKSWGPFWSCQLNSTANLAHLANFLGKWAELAVLFSWWLQTDPQEFDVFNCHGCKRFILPEIHCYLSTLKSWRNNSFLSGVRGNKYFCKSRQVITYLRQALLKPSPLLFLSIQNQDFTKWHRIVASSWATPFFPLEIFLQWLSRNF